MLDRRTFVAAAGATLAAPAIAARRSPAARSRAAFLWGAATAGHQIEGNNTNSDMWLLENVQPTVFAEPSATRATAWCCGR